MADSCTALEFPVVELADRPSTTCYAIRFRGRASNQVAVCLQEYWRRAWERAGRSVPPALVILDSDIELLTAHYDADLRAVGVLRIEAGQ
jgi:hypothetical protein